MISTESSYITKRVMLKSPVRTREIARRLRPGLMTIPMRFGKFGLEIIPDWNLSSMSRLELMKKRRVLIASSHPLFAQGLRSLLKERRQAGVDVVGVVTNLDEALQALERLNPDLIIVDYDDQKLNRDEFLARFVEGEKKLRVVLLSLQSAQEAIVYDRRTLAAAQIDDWLEEWNFTDENAKPVTVRAPQGRLLRNAARTTSDDRRAYMKKRFGSAIHLIIAGVLVLISTALLIFGMRYIRILPVAASAQATPIDWLFDLEFKVIAFLFSLIVVFMLYSIVVFRRRRGDETDAAHIEGSSRLEVAWTIAPLVTVLFFAYLGGNNLAATVAPEPRPLRVEVIGRQWSWSFVYPELGVISDQLYLPQNRQALLLLRSEDVIHSFWVPEFRVKQDALPGGQDFVRPLRVTPTMIGEYRVRCAELCGTQHAYMESPVFVVSPEEFDSWAAEAAGLSDDPLERGQQWATQFGCVACHSVDGSQLVGPSWVNMCDGQETMNDGTVLEVTDEYIRESIINPDVHVVQGFAPGIMPKQFVDPITRQPITDQQINDLIQYQRSICQ
jgi:cytochrome c oxidase subunit 2